MSAVFANPLGPQSPTPAGTTWTCVRVPAFDRRMAEVRGFLDSIEATGLWRFQPDTDPRETQHWAMEFTHPPTAVLFKMRFG